LQLDDNLNAIDVALTIEDKAVLDEASKLSSEYPAWMDVLGTDRRPGNDASEKARLSAETSSPTRNRSEVD